MRHWSRISSLGVRALNKGPRLDTGLTAMTYEIRPRDFGFTIPRQLLLAVGTLACFGLGMLLAPGTPTSRDILFALLAWVLFTMWWYYDHHYYLEINDHDARVGGRVVREGRVRYLREANHLIGGARLVLSERETAWAHLCGSAIVIPNRLAQYEQIKAKLLAWVANSTPDTQ